VGTTDLSGVRYDCFGASGNDLIGAEAVEFMVGAQIGARAGGQC